MNFRSNSALSLSSSSSFPSFFLHQTNFLIDNISFHNRLILYFFIRFVCCVCVFFFCFRFFSRFFCCFFGVRCLNLSHLRLNFLLRNFWNVYCFLTASNYFFNMNIFTSFGHSSRHTRRLSLSLSEFELKTHTQKTTNMERQLKKKTEHKFNHYPL